MIDTGNCCQQEIKLKKMRCLVNKQKRFKSRPL